MKSNIQSLKRRIKVTGCMCIGLATLFGCHSGSIQKQQTTQPNILVVLTDQWRADAFGHRGNPDVLTPNIDQLAEQGVQFVNAVSGMPVCTPARASLLTGQRPLTNGVFMNDVQLDTNAVSLGKVMAANGYQTAYIGKWHLDGSGRRSFIPRGNRRQGFQYWKVLECTHNYNHSIYYADNADRLLWEGYDAISQTEDACGYIHRHANDREPFLLYLSYGPPHAPYLTAPEKYRQLYSAEKIHLGPNVPDEMREKVQKDFAGYYAHCTALDDMVGQLRAALVQSGIYQNTIILFLSDHGDLLGSHGYYKKQQPYDESIRIPMIFYVPEALGGKPAIKKAMINVEDVMPTLLGFSSIEIPETVEGFDYSGYIKGGGNPGDTVTLITCVQPFGQWSRNKGGKEYRGLRSFRYTYVKNLNGPWLFFDNQADPFQMNNLIDNEQYAGLIKSFDQLLTKKLEEHNDEFLPGMEYVKKWNYPPLDTSETIPFKN
ncbi:MAG: sulfatase [Prolixibacteraceae bacterium]|nr:sulfatase [Prolixibacteraceae bacterium]